MGTYVLHVECQLQHWSVGVGTDPVGKMILTGVKAECGLLFHVYVS